MKHKFIKNFWNVLPSWQNILDDLSLNIQDQSPVKMSNNLGFVTHRGERINEIFLLMNYIKSIEPNCSNVDAHIYISLLSNSETFGNHKDEMDVYYIQAQGKTKYIITEDNKEFEYIVEPGDMAFFPKGIFHNPIILTPRVGISIGIT